MRSMLRLFSISLSMLIFLQSINIHFKDLVELGALVEHYQFHKETYSDNFLSFVSKHYGEDKTQHNQQHEEEQEEHEGLPFQHQSHCSHLVVFMVSPKPMLESRAEIPASTSGNFHYDMSYSQIWEDGLFQPPKQA